MKVIDGSMLEGGGQILRTSIALASVLGEPVKVTNIRAKRKNPGLRPQHLTAIKSVASIVQGTVKGLSIGSDRIEFCPGRLRGGVYRIDIGTAGSIALVLQAVFPVAIYAPESITLELTGGTNVAFAPQIDYIVNVFNHWMKRIGVEASIEIIKRGTYPRGGGFVKAHIRPIEYLEPFRFTEKGDVRGINGISWCERLPRHVADRQKNAALKILENAGFRDVEIKIESGRTSLSPGSGIVLWAETTEGCRLGSDSLGERGKRAEIVGEEAANRLINELKVSAPLDRHMGDQIIPFMALAGGVSAVKTTVLTLHTKTNMHVAEQILDVRFDVKIENGAIISVRGIGFRRY